MMLNKLSLSTAVAVATLSIGAMAQSAQAALFNFSYILAGGSILSGMLDGEIQGDNDTVIVSAITMQMFNGANGSLAPDLPFIDSATNVFGSSGLPPVVSLSGTAMDIAACTNALCSDDGFVFEASGVFGFPLYNGGPSYGNVLEPYNPANWTLTPQDVATTPEPSSVIALALIGGSLLLTKRVKG